MNENNKNTEVENTDKKLHISDVIISTDKLTEYQLEILTRLREKFNDLRIEIVRGDRLMVNGVVITGGVLIWDSRNRKDYDNGIKFFSDEIKLQYLAKRHNWKCNDYGRCHVICF
ncbi:hypothetical protein EBS02_02835 [bacterium]|nr:hypothetical protein [bacterium]